MSVRKGTYLLLIELDRGQTINIGAKGPHHFKKGRYCYVGSAMAGLDQRLKRHLAHEKTLKWHADYLTTACDRSSAWESYPDYIPECELAAMVEASGGVPEMDGFGCSDCNCRTHLFRVNKAVMAKVVSSTGVKLHE